MRISYDFDTDVWGPLQPVLTAEQTGRSISELRVSPDGRFLLFCMADHGAFPVLQADCDLYLMDLTQGDRFPFRPLTLTNSPESDSWHSWSSNSRWIVFSSKRGNGLFARPHLCYIDQEGNEHKPFVLPQQDPLFYDSYLKTYSVPELLQGPVRVQEEQLVRAILSTKTGDEHARTEVAAPN
ncbi:MAG: TolB family protein [Pirellulaceae bacterium]